MSDKRQGIDEREMLRYLNNEMSSDERHAFEKKLEKDPFAYEAMEGMEQFDPGEIARDLNDIRQQMQPWRRKPVMMWKIAAAVALMVLAGVSAWRLTTQETAPLASKNEVAADSTIALNQKTDEKPVPEAAESAPQEAEEITNGPAVASAAGAGEVEVPAGSTRIEVADQVAADMILDADEAVAAESEDLATELEVLAEVTVVEQPEPEAAKEVLDEGLAEEVITEAPVAVAADDAAETGGAAQRSTPAKKAEADYRSQFNATGAVSPAYFNPQLASPDMGWAAFEKYLRNNQQRGEGIVSGAVVLSFTINESGTPTDIKVVNSLCEPCDKEAIRLLESSGGWTYCKSTTGTPATSVSIQLRR